MWECWHPTRGTQALTRRECDVGNDLARCLNWGGGLYVLRDRGLPAMLHDVEHATVSLLDRWTVQITRQPQELSSTAQQIQRMSSLVARDKPEAEQVHMFLAHMSCDRISRHAGKLKVLTRGSLLASMPHCSSARRHTLSDGDDCAPEQHAALLAALPGAHCAR